MIRPMTTLLRDLVKIDVALEGIRKESRAAGNIRALYHRAAVPCFYARRATLRIERDVDTAIRLMDEACHDLEGIALRVHPPSTSRRLLDLAKRLAAHSDRMKGVPDA